MSNENNITVELLCLDKSMNLDKFLSFCFASSDDKIDKICLPTGLLNFVPEISDYLKVASQVDFPDGLSSTVSRTHDIMYSLRREVKCVDITLNNVLITDGNWKELGQELKGFSELCLNNNTQLRAILEYRLHSSKVIENVCSILENNGINEIIIATGRLADDTIDNLLACESIKSKTKLDVVACGRIYTEDQISMFRSAGIEKFRMTSLNAAENLIGKLADS